MQKSRRSVLRSWQETKKLTLCFPFIFPCLLAAIVGVATQDSEMMLFAPIVGLGAGLFLLLLGSPLLFVKQTATPSKWQRFCREYTLHTLTRGWHRKNKPLLPILPHKYYQETEHSVTYFKFWLSHPNIELSQEQYNYIVSLNTTLFDWQDPSKWPL